MVRRRARATTTLGRTLVASAVLAVVDASVARAEPNAAAVVTAGSATETPNRFRLQFVLPLWIPFLDFTSSAQSRGDLSDLIETQTEVRWVATGMLEIGYRPIIARVDVFGAGFGDQLLRRDGEPTDVTAHTSALMTRGILMYELGPWHLSRRHADRRFVFGPLIGARYNRIGIEGAERSDLAGKYWWIDPLVGVRDEFQLGSWRIGMHTDVGGFGVSSDLAFWASASVEYMIVRWFSIWVGWQHYQVLFQRKVDHGPTSLELLLTGPSAGLGFHVL